MKPVDLPGRNIVFAKDQPEYIPLPAILLQENGQVITCWEMTEEEFHDFSKTRKIYLSQFTFGSPLQPILPAVNLDDFFTLTNG